MISITKEYNFSKKTITIQSEKNITINNINKCFETLGIDK